MAVYEPEEDSFLLEEQVKMLAKGKVLDMGSGSGIQAIAAAKKKNVKSAVAADIQKDAVEFCRKQAKSANLGRKITCVQSNLFSKIAKQEFDTIIFNAPYLPQDEGIKDAALYGGKKGYEIFEKFLKKAPAFLSEKGIILLLISSLTSPKKVEDALYRMMLDFEAVSKKHIFFEDLIVYRISKNPAAEKLKKMGVKGLKYFSHGHRGIIFTGTWKGIKIAAKAKLAKSRAEGHIANEAKWIKELNRLGVGPSLEFSGKDFLAYRFVDGIMLPEFAEKSPKKEVVNALADVFIQCRKMDELGIDKEEMHRPFKHIIMDGRNQKPVLIDFERAHRSEKPKNVTQFLQYIASGKMTHVLKKKGISISCERAIALGRDYRQGKIGVKEIISAISGNLK